METINISDNESDNEVQYLSPTSVADRFGGEDLCQRARIHRYNRFANESVPLDQFNEDYVQRRLKEESDRNGFNYEIDSILESVQEIKAGLSSDNSNNSDEDSDNDSVNEIFGETTESDLRHKWTPNVFLKPDDELKEVSEEYSLSSGLDWDDTNSSCLAYDSISVRPSESFQKAFFFNKSFLDRLKRLQCTDVRLELHMWPSIIKNISVACISGPKSGKTTSYLVPLMNWFDSRDGQTLKDESKIGAIVICGSTRQTFRIAQLAKLWRDPNVLPMEQTIRIVSLNSGNEKKQMTSVLNGCDILVTTPEPLLRALSASIIDCTHTQCLIIDDADVCLSVHLKTIREIYLLYANMKKTIKPFIKNGVVHNPMAFQTMIFAQRWTPDVQWFIKEVQHLPNILFGSHLEASVALKVKCEVEVIDSEMFRERTVFAIIKQVVGSDKHRPRIAVICRDHQEMEYLFRYIKPNINGLNVIEVTHQTPHYDLEQRRQVWNRLGGLLFINDDAIKVVDGFQSCNCLIHYKLPKNFDQSFGDRYRLMRRVMKSYKSPMEMNGHKRQLSSYVVITPIDRDIPQLLEYLKRLNTTIPDKLSSIYDLNCRPICDRFASFGSCPFEKTFCADRHLFAPSDTPLAEVVSNGQIKLVVTYVKGTNQFYFRLNAVRNECQIGGQWQPMAITFEQIRPELNQLLDKPFNSVDDLSNKEIYGISIRGEVLRVRVIQIKTEEDLKYYEKYDEKDKRQRIEVFCVDFGHKLWTHVRQLFHLPEHLKSLRPFAHKAYLFGIKPIDNEIDWDFRSVQKFYELVDNYRVLELTAWVLKQVKGVFWLNRLQVSKRLNNTRLKVDANPIKHLIDTKYVALNDQRLPTANTDFNRIVNSWHNHKLSSVTSQSYLVNDSTYVVLSDFVSLNHFYLIKEDRVNRLQQLEDKWSVSLRSTEPLKELAVDQLCFYEYSDRQYEEKSYNRAKIVAIDDDSVDVFLVDHGELVQKADPKCLYPILESHLRELPFQAIKVSLFGAKELKRITHDLVCELTRDDNDQYRMCIADKLSFADGVHTIRLFVSDNQYETSFTSLSKLLVDKTFAQYIDGEEDNELELIVEKEKNYSDEGELDDYNEYLEDLCADNMCKIVLSQLGLNPNETLDPSPKAEAKPESRASKTLRRLRAIEAKNKPEEEESDEEEDKPSRLPLSVSYTPGEFDYPYDSSNPLWFDPSDHLDDSCDFTDEEGGLEEEDMS